MSVTTPTRKPTKEAAKAAKVKAAQDAWHETNPLRKWRTKNDVSIMATASQLKVSMTIIQLWERGVHVPSPTSMDKIVALLGPRSRKAWATWLQARP